MKGVRKGVAQRVVMPRREPCYKGLMVAPWCVSDWQVVGGRAVAAQTRAHVVAAHRVRVPMHAWW